MRYMANSRLADGVTADQFTAYFEANGVSSEAWALVRHRIVTDYAFKIGDEPGVVFFLRADSEDEARELIDSIPVVKQGLLRFEVDPLDRVMRM